jgi:ABC-type multidrug transport system ATPase subunit
VSSHDLSELEKVVGRVLVLDGGRLLREVRPGTGVDLESLLLGAPASTLEREPPA